jgi:hypothetical protein
MVYEFFKNIFEFFGVVGSQQSFTLGNSAGRAAVSTGTTSAQGALSKLQQSAFSIGGAGPDPGQQTANNTKSLLEYFIQDFPGVITEAFRTAINEKAQQTTAGIAGAAVSFVGGLKNLSVGRYPF